MRKAEVFQQGTLAGVLEETGENRYRFSYAPSYHGRPDFACSASPRSALRL